MESVARVTLAIKSTVWIHRMKLIKSRQVLYFWFEVRVGVRVQKKVQN